MIFSEPNFCGSEQSAHLLSIASGNHSAKYILIYDQTRILKN